MRLATYLMVALLSLSACKKAVQKHEEDLLLQLIVSSQWVVNKYKIDTSDVAPMFTHYRFQFKKDYTVDAINDGVVDNTGTWSGSVTTKTISSNFPNPNPALSLLNGTWHVTDSGLDYVEATQVVNSKNHFLRLVKK